MPIDIRTNYIEENFTSEISTLNYIKAIHVTIYGIVCVNVIRSRNWIPAKKRYAKTMVTVFLASALLQAYYTVFAESYSTFIIYFFSASTFIAIIGYVLYFKPEALKQIEQKYFTSQLSKAQRQVIATKIMGFLQKKEHFTNTEMSLNLLSEEIGEKKHRISQTLSQELNTSFNGLINTIRVDYSKQLLKNPDFDKYKILGIALEVGFTNKSTFNRAFVKLENSTPSEFRKKRRPK